MKLNFIWDKERAIDEVEIIANPVNIEKLAFINEGLSSNTTLNVQNPKNNRRLRIEIQQIISIEAIGHLTKVILINNEEYLLQKRLKELQVLEAKGLYRINNSTILNLAHVQSFASGEYARLEVFTTNNNKYIASRHYAKRIKEKLS